MPKGSEKLVTPSNVPQYIEAVVRTRLHENDAVLDAIRSGIADMIPAALLCLFTWKEMERLACGVEEIDLALLRK